MTQLNEIQQCVPVYVRYLTKISLYSQMYSDFAWYEN